MDAFKTMYLNGFAFGAQFFWEITVTYSMLLQLNM